MRKVDPADVRSDFASESRRIIDHFDRVSDTLRGTATKEQDISQLATQSFLALFVAFERFLSDLFLAYLNREFDVYKAQLHKRVINSIEDKYGPGVRSLITIKKQRHIRVDKLEDIVDPRGRNLAFPNIKELKKKATDWLAPMHAKRINSINAEEKRLIETSHAIRDFIAHQSHKSKKDMNLFLSRIERGSKNRYLGRGANEVHSIGSYLKAVRCGKRRLHLYAAKLSVLSAHI